MKKLVVGVAVAGALLGVAGSVEAGQPVVPGCVGASVSANAQATGPYGQFISSVAPRNDFGSVGDAVQAVQAGQVDDSLYWNTCND
jgi:hypothetical protein